MSAAVSTGIFEWDIQNAFLQRRSYEAKFCHGAPNSRLWKVTLESMDRRVSYRQFALCLEYLEWFEPRYEIVAESLKVRVNLNSKTIKEEELRMYPFCISNRFKCYMDVTAEMPFKTKPYRMVVRIEISLPGSGVGSSFKDYSLRKLSNDLELLLRNPKYPDATLWSESKSQDFSVHSCIIDARWSNFASKHKIFENDWMEVKTKISSALLSDILTYVYSGAVSLSWPFWLHPSYATELFQVMEWYGMNRFCKAFVKDDLQHERVTRSTVVAGSLLFPLGIVNDSYPSRAYTWRLGSKPDESDKSKRIDKVIDPNEIVVRIGIGNEAGNWLWYSLQSKSKYRVYAEVKFRLEKEVEGEKSEALNVRNEGLVEGKGKETPKVEAKGNPDVEGKETSKEKEKKPESLPFHEQEFTIDPNQSVAPRSVLFLGCPETFGDFLSPRADGKSVKYFVCCFVNLTYETTVEQITSDVSGGTSELSREMLAALSNDMRKVQKRKLRADMQIQSCPEFFDRIVLGERIHRGIFAARVPEWWRGVKDANPENDVPEVAKSTLSFETLPAVLEYIYTGKPDVVCNIYSPYVRELERFAQQTSFDALHDIVICSPRDFYGEDENFMDNREM